MQGAIARMCMVVAAAILNHPLFFPQENVTLPEQDEELMARMREHEERLKMEEARLEKELAQMDSKQEKTSSDDAYTWYFWSAVSFVIFFTIEMCRVDLADAELRPVEDEDIVSEDDSVLPRMMVLDKDVLRNFCDKCTYTSTHERRRVTEFVEGFADDLLESLRSVCNSEAGTKVGDFLGIGSMFESWKVFKPLMCDLIVALSPADPHSFQYRLWCSSPINITPDLQGCGTIKVTRFGEGEEGCLCGSVNLGEDLLCLLHSRNVAVKVSHGPDELLCSKGTHFLSKDQVMRWFQISVTKAWARISYKYDFEVTFRNLDAAGALKIRFPSGKVIGLNIIPVVQLGDTDAYFVLRFPSDHDSCPDPYWPLSFAVYEQNLLKYFAKRLPKSSCHLHCLQICTFLHRKQSGLTGQSALTSYHLKTAVLHLLLSTRTTSWRAESLAHRLQDVFSFLQMSLQEKRLYHALIGNRRVPEEVQVPEMFRKADPINLFRSLVLQRELYASTVRHFQEMLRNAPVLLEEYTPYLSNGSLHHSVGASS